MKCMTPGCKSEACDGGNHCEEHLWEDDVDNLKPKGGSDGKSKGAEIREDDK